MAEKEDEDNDRVARLGFRPQKEIVYNKLLPYANQLDDDSSKMFIEIKTNLGNAVMMRELRPSCVIWTTRLRKYIQLYGLKMSKDDHIHLIHLLYELVTLPKVESYLVNKFSRILISLLKKKDLLLRSELCLPWRPLYDTCCRILSNGRSSVAMFRYPSNLQITVYSLVHTAKFYFPASATKEILEEISPELCPFDNHIMTLTVEKLESFLPVALPPTLYDQGYKLWFEDMMTLWETCNNAPNWECDIMWMMARLAYHNVGHINWEPYIPMMFTRFLRSFHLPVSYRQMSNSRAHKLETSAIALWIVSVLGGGSSAQKFLDKFMMAVESYFHPANMGRWIQQLSELLSNLPAHFVHRLKYERNKVLTWRNPVPESQKLTEDDITKFVESIRPVAMKAMFSKMGVEVAQAMQHLATLRPNLIVPEIVESVYSNLESVVQPHKFQAALHCLVAVARPMVEGKHDYKEGPTHVIPLLLAVLPGIDPNDTRKCFVVFYFISTLSALLPFVDCSNASTYHKNLTEEEETVCLATANFEDFISQFFDRCFLLIESSAMESIRPEQYTEKRSRMENMSETALASTCVAVLSQTSPSIFKTALKKVHSFAMSRILETNVAGKIVATMCRSFAKVNPDETFRLFLPHLCDNIIALTNSDDVLNEEVLDNELLYNLLLISEIVDCAGKSLLPHVQILKEVLNRTLHLTCNEGSSFARNLLRLMFESLSTTVPIEHSSVPRPFNEDLEHYLPIKDWGKPGNIHDLKLSWYVPGEEEVACVQSLVSEYLPREIERIEMFIEDETQVTRNELQWSLKIIYSIFGCHTLLPMWDEEPLHLIRSCLPQSPFSSIKKSVKFSVTMPDGSNVRKTLAILMDKLQLKLLEFKEDDTRLLLGIVTIWNSLLTSRDDNTAFEVRCKKFYLVKKVLENKLIGNKKHLRAILIDHALLQHELLVDHNSLCLTETHKMMMMNLLTLSTSKYSEVRIRAQNKLVAALKKFPFSYIVLVERLVECLKVDSDMDHDRFKGALYVLLAPKQNPIIIHDDWSILRKLWPAIIQARPSEKMSVIRLLENVGDVVHKYFASVTLKIEIPNRCVDLARKLWDCAPFPTQEPASDEQIGKGMKQLELRNKDNLEQYLSLLLSLHQSIENGNLHWRFHLMALGFLRDLVHPDVAYPPPLVRCFVNTLIHDSLQLRKIAIRCVIFVLKHQKQTHFKIDVEPYSLCKVQKPDKVCPGNRPDNQWVQYKSSQIPQNAEDWNEPRYAHQVYHGYYGWPKMLELYAPSLEEPPLMHMRGRLSEGESEVHDFFMGYLNVERMMNFLSLEEKKGKDKFNGYKFLFFKGLFRNGGLKMFLVFVPFLQNMVRSKLENEQRCSSEIIAAAVRGAKHWPYEMVEGLWQVLDPIIRCALSNMTEETVADWGICFATSAEHRDPHRNHWLFEVLLEESCAGDTSCNECGRFYAAQGALNQQSWRMSELLNIWIERLKPYLSHPYQNVRERIGSVLNSTFEIDVTHPGGNPPQSPRISSLMNFIIPQLRILHEEGVECTHGNQGGGDAEETPSHGDGDDDAVNSRNSALRLLKTVCRWITLRVSRSQFGISPDFYRLLPLICFMESYEADEEVGQLCSSALTSLGFAVHVPENISAGIAAIQKVSLCCSWQSRAAGLEFLQVFAFNNMSMIANRQEWKSEVRNMVLRLLEDDWLNVREKAAQVLGGLQHIGFIENTSELLGMFQQKASTKISKTMSRIDHVSCKLRHSGVLGLCAFINAYPYDVPDFVPELFVVLGQHLNDPEPIASTIRKTLGDFKRTHHDNWAQHSLKFTEAQLTVLGDLTIPPSYYA